MYIKIKSENQIDRLVSLAKKIWHEHFGPMFEKETLEYLIDQVQSKESILKQVKEGYLYFFIFIEGKEIGYFAYKIYEDKNELFLSKLYILSSERKKGIGREVINYLEDILRNHNLKKLSLTVFYKNSGSIKAYEKLGFKNMGIIERDIGKGVIVKDYRMEKIVNN